MAPPLRHSGGDAVVGGAELGTLGRRGAWKARRSRRREDVYSGYFRDLDGHLWEVLWNPRLYVP